MKKIICYGDSNTYGFIPSSGLRYGISERWSGILKQELKDYYEVIEAGLNNRNGFYKSQSGKIYCACEHLEEFIDNFNDIGIFILAIGTNDTQFLYDFSIEKIEEGLIKLIKIINKKTDNIILIPPVIMNENIVKGYFKIQFDLISIDKSKQMNALYRSIAKKFKIKLFDFNEFTSPSNIDGLHYDLNNHKVIAQKLKDYILKQSN